MTFLSRTFSHIIFSMHADEGNWSVDTIQTMTVTSPGTLGCTCTHRVQKFHWGGGVM